MNEQDIAKIALDALRRQREEIDQQIAELERIVGGKAGKRRGRPPGKSTSATGATSRGGAWSKMSPKERKLAALKMASFQRERWKLGRKLDPNVRTIADLNRVLRAHGYGGKGGKAVAPPKAKKKSRPGRKPTVRLESVA